MITDKEATISGYEKYIDSLILSLRTFSSKNEHNIFALTKQKLLTIKNRCEMIQKCCDRLLEFYS